MARLEGHGQNCPQFTRERKCCGHYFQRRFWSAAPERPLPKGSHLAARNPSAPPIRPDPTTLRPRPDSPACFAIATPSPAPRPPSALRSRRLTTFQVQDAGSTPRARHRADADRAAMGWLVVHRWAPHRQDSLGLEFGMLRTSLPLVSAYSSCTEDNERHSRHLAYKSPCQSYAHFLTGTVTALSRPSRESESYQGTGYRKPLPVELAAAPFRPESTGRKPASSCLAKGNHWVHPGCAPRWKIAG